MCQINALATTTGEGKVFCPFNYLLLSTNPCHNKRNVAAFKVFDVVFFLYHESDLVNNITILDIFTKRFITQTKLLYVP